MAEKKRGAQSVLLQNRPRVLSFASMAGPKEAEGPLAGTFDETFTDDTLGEKSWERGEAKMLEHTVDLALSKARVYADAVDAFLGGDLLNQIVSASYTARQLGAPFLGLYGACSTMADALCLGALLIDGGAGEKVAALTSSHFCSAERQFRFPLEYGSVRTPTSQWTATAAGAVILAADAPAPYVTRVTPGRIVDAGVTDTSNMGAAMAMAAADTLSRHFADTARAPDYYDAVLTGDLGKVGSDILAELLAMRGITLGARHMDCGVLIFDAERQGVCSGGSGCGCSASVLSGYVLDNMRAGVWKRVLFAATGALMSPTTSLQGESIPGICHAAALETERC